MSRRFSNEPINLIRRIPSPEQLDAARSVKRPVGGKFSETAASFARSVGELLAQIGSQRTAAGSAEPYEAPQTEQEEMRDLPVELSAEDNEPPDPRMSDAEPIELSSGETVHVELQKSRADHVQAEPPAIQPDELAELRAYLLRQQQDIVRLAAQMQDLKVLVLSQQQIIEYLGKELAIRPESLLAVGITSGTAKQNRSPRTKPMTHEKEVGSEGDSIRLPLNV
ncbi:MAG: hypothetical protein OEY28_02235 [Nitrospira sp.]|nr:hypothetical protein [Nitrospira sp.]